MGLISFRAMQGAAFLCKLPRACHAWLHTVHGHAQGLCVLAVLLLHDSSRSLSQRWHPAALVHRWDCYMAVLLWPRQYCQPTVHHPILRHQDCASTALPLLAKRHAGSETFMTHDTSAPIMCRCDRVWCCNGPVLLPAGGSAADRFSEAACKGISCRGGAATARGVRGPTPCVLSRKRHNKLAYLAEGHGCCMESKELMMLPEPWHPASTAAHTSGS